MFTGLIEDVGTIRSIRSLGGGKKFFIESEVITQDCKIDDSVAVNGACQTVVEVEGNIFAVEAVEETLKKTTLNEFRQGYKVNLERAAKLGDRMGGHLVQGHIDCAGTIAAISKLQTGINVWISYPVEYDKYVVPVGSVAINGISLTIAKKESYKLMVSVIPHTWKVTNLNLSKPGDKINLEFDIIGKYVENMVKKSDTSSLNKYLDQPEY